MYKIVFIELSGICTAKCPYCPTGQKKLNGRPGKGGFLAMEDFAMVIKDLREKGVMDEGTRIDLFKWGEPFLNPSFNEIVSYLSQEDIPFGLSTNASMLKTFSAEPVLSNLRFLRFSMPGFSQSSYTGIHGFDIAEIKDNISKIVYNFRQCGFEGHAEICFHVYQFNKDEITAARDFATSLGISFNPFYAIFNGVNMYLSYLKQEMDYRLLQRASKEMVLYYVDELIEKTPPDYRCPQWEDILAIDEECNV